MITSCFYSYTESCIIDASVKDKKLIIHTFNFYKYASIQDIGDLLKLKENKIWINKHEPLKTVIPKVYEFDIFGDDSNELMVLTDVWLDLKNNNRVEVLNNFKLSDTEAQSNALKILVKALNYELFKEPMNIGKLGVVTPRFKYQFGMRRR
jgi:hypothetical protein